MFDRPILLWLLILLPLVVAPAAIAIRNRRFAAGISAGLLRSLAFVALVLALAGFGIRTRAAARRMETVALLDQSRSIAPDQQEWMRSRVRELARVMRPDDHLAVLGFGRDTRLLSPMGDPRLLSL